MPSPFPGMDPYLERHWRDIHQRLITYGADQLQPQLPRGLKARVEERVFVQSPEGLTRSFYPDVRIVEPLRSASRQLGSTAVADRIAEPILVRAQDEPFTESFIQVIDVSTGGSVVTAIEFLSPTNKLAEGARDYRLKRADLLEAGVSVVEVDLLRAGERSFSVPSQLLPPQTRSAYAACVRRGWDPAGLEIYPFSIRESLPAIRVPLRQSDGDVLLGLQTLIDRCYENGGYYDTDYTADPEPPLSPEDAEWADALLREKGFRPAPQRDR